MSTGQEEPFDFTEFLNTLTNQPGVYRMVGSSGEVLYVGKARQLKKRVASYFRRSAQSAKVMSMMSQVGRVEVTVTRSEGEALILENNLIKEHRPRYNVLLRDDKSYPYLHLTSDQRYPRLRFHRGSTQGAGRFFGPYPSAGAVRATLNLLQKLFQIRQCEDSYFENRTRPCLQYQIKRCTAPCVGYVDDETYARDVRHAVMFLEGKSNEVIDDLVNRMEAASQALDFEGAARYRDQIRRLRQVQEQQYVSGERGDVDIVAVVSKAGVSCVQVFYIRGGRNLGNRTYFPRVPDAADDGEVLRAFLIQRYMGQDCPSEILVNEALEDADALAEVLGDHAGHTVTVSHRLRGERARWLQMAATNAEHALNARLVSRSGKMQQLEAVQEVLGMAEMPGRIECFDVSHTQGEATVASCVVFGQDGPVKSDYRRFNIGDVDAGDDYHAIQQVLMRRYRRVQQEGGRLPELIIIDGGRNQVNVAVEVLQELGVVAVTVVGVAKGPERRPGMERLFLSDRKAPIILPEYSPALHLLQQVRDEAHRFALTGHRQRRARARNTSSLEEIPGLGPRRRQRLLKQFGGLREVTRAGVDDLARVPGIGRPLAQRIYEALHTEDR